MADEMKKCPFCGEEIKATAKKCKHCGEWLEKQEEVVQTKQCPICGEDVPANASTCEHCGEILSSVTPIHNNAMPHELPPELKKYNWGAFLVPFLWVWFNGAPKNISIIVLVLFLMMYIPFVGVFAWLIYCGFQIWIGTQGNQWAWNNKKWDSINSFNKYQQKWVVYSLIGMLGLCIIGGIIGAIVGGTIGAIESM